MKFNKEQAIKALIFQIESELTSLVKSAKTAHAAATHEESRAEDRHDTFAIEASYLAAGQATRVSELTRTLQEFQTYSSQGPLDWVRPGALVTYHSEGHTSFVFFAILGGGTKITLDEIPIQVLSMKSPLGESFLDARMGEEITFENRGIEKTCQIISIE